ncbi:unnamed protein product, partial [Gadus morhua 'NCC']
PPGSQRVNRSETQSTRSCKDRFPPARPGVVRPQTSEVHRAVSAFFGTQNRAPIRRVVAGAAPPCATGERGTRRSARNGPRRRR